MMDALGNAGSTYRKNVYRGFSEKQAPVSLSELHDFFDIALKFIDHSILANQRADKLYHSYNLMQVEEDGGISIGYLYEMLEGQVAVLTSDLLSAREAVEVLNALRKSAIYRPDQHSYLLYPDRNLPRFKAKNNIPVDVVKQSRLLRTMVEKEDRRLVEKDLSGNYHFNGDFRNQHDLEDALVKIEEDEYAEIIRREKNEILGVFEMIFDHKSFTGRSGTFFGYEGVGCIYWHMVSKLLLVVEENCWRSIENGEKKNLTEQLIEHYYDVRAGIGFNKTPDVYGAFPTDPYSHTPGNKGAQQPGMTGQVKEDILARFGELGVFVQAGRIIFRPQLINHSEFINEESAFTYYNLDGKSRELLVSKGSLAFTYCQVPIIYHKSNKEKIILNLLGQDPIEISGLEIPQEWSDQMMLRTGKIEYVEVFFTLPEII
jgi:hypothetical protein